MSTRIGTIAEQKFKLMCLELDIPLFEPIIDNIGIDYVIKKSSKYHSIQIKSTIKRDPTRNSYKINVQHKAGNVRYKNKTYDYLVVFIFELSIWYIIPEALVRVTTIRVNPNSDKGKYAKYKEAWNLLK